jgi:hypothetical protein
MTGMAQMLKVHSTEREIHREARTSDSKMLNAIWHPEMVGQVWSPVMMMIINVIIIMLRLLSERQ